MLGAVELRDKEKNASVRLEIRSRFDPSKEQYFVNYMLSKVLKANFTELISAQEKETPMWDLLLAFAFVRDFQKAAEVGPYRRYVENAYNDLNFRGKLDLARHIELNFPLFDRIAYSVHEIAYDNPLNHLLRFALEKIGRKWPSMLENDGITASFVNQLKQMTPTWDPQGLPQILKHKDTRFPLGHPYYKEYYEPLRRIARMLLTDEGAAFEDDLPDSDSDAEISGVLLDGAWLWEEYLATLLAGSGYIHSDPEAKTGGIQVFESKTYPLYPDFRSNDKRIILDAKYKNCVYEDKSSKKPLLKEGEPDDIQQV